MLKLFFVWGENFAVWEMNDYSFVTVKSAKKSNWKNSFHLRPAQEHIRSKGEQWLFFLIK